MAEFKAATVLLRWKHVTCDVSNLSVSFVFLFFSVNVEILASKLKLKVTTDLLGVISVIYKTRTIKTGS